MCIKAKKRYIDSYYEKSEAEQLFNEVDEDGSRNITIHEADQYLKDRLQDKRDATFSLRDQIVIMDKNKDGVIAPYEFYDSLSFSRLFY